MRLKALTNVRPVKELGTQVILAPTPGQFKVTPDACKLLGVGAGSYVGVAVDDESGSGFVFKGSEDGLGAKLASSSKSGGGILNFSAAAGWTELEGSAEHNIHFNIGTEPLSAEDVAGTVFEGYELYPLVMDKKVEKQQRKASEAGDNDGDDLVAAPAAEVDANDFSDM